MQHLPSKWCKAGVSLLLHIVDYHVILARDQLTNNSIVAELQMLIIVTGQIILCQLCHTQTHHTNNCCHREPTEITDRIIKNFLQSSGCPKNTPKFKIKVNSVECFFWGTPCRINEKIIPNNTWKNRLFSAPFDRNISQTLMIMMNPIQSSLNKGVC